MLENLKMGSIAGTLSAIHLSLCKSSVIDHNAIVESLEPATGEENIPAWNYPSLVPSPTPSFRCLQYGKAGRTASDEKLGMGLGMILDPSIDESISRRASQLISTTASQYRPITDFHAGEHPASFPGHVLGTRLESILVYMLTNSISRLLTNPASVSPHTMP